MHNTSQQVSGDPRLRSEDKSLTETELLTHSCHLDWTRSPLNFSVNAVTDPNGWGLVEIGK